MEIAGYIGLIPIGRGGFSTVYRGRQVALDREVAIKVLAVDLGSDAARNRFHRECATNGRVGAHPNIVTVFDSGFTGDGQPFLSMQLCPDGSLGDALRRKGPLPVEQVLHAGVSIATALAFAHRAGVLHRDIKPENIMLGPFGEALLADFGIAVVDDQRISTATAASFTVNHAAPECLVGEPPSTSSDLYSLASTLYTLLAGNPPFVAASGMALASLLSMVLNDPPPPLSRGDIPASLTDLLIAGLAKNPADRPADAAAFSLALQQVQVELGLPITARLMADQPVARPPLPGPPNPSGTVLANPLPQPAEERTAEAPTAASGPLIAETLTPSMTTYGMPPPPVADVTVLGFRPETVARPGSSPTVAERSSRRGRSRTVMIAAAVILVLAAGGSTYYFLQPTHSDTVADGTDTVGEQITPTIGAQAGADVTPPTSITGDPPRTADATAESDAEPTPDSGDTSSTETASITTTEAPTVNRGPADPCEILAQSEAEDLAAVPLNEGKKVGSGDTRTCLFTGLPSGPTAQVELTIGEGAKNLLLADQTLGHEFTALSGIGDEALIERSHLFFRKADTWVVLRLIRVSDPEKYAKAMEDLARKLVDRI